MTIKFAKRVASEILKRGGSSIRINPSSIDDAKKAMTREDVRALVKTGGIYAIKQKENKSINSKLLKIRRSKGRGRGQGKRKGTLKARNGEKWLKKVRSQRFLLLQLKNMGKLDNALYNKYYMLIKGNSFSDKGSLLLHLRERGINITEEESKVIKEQMSARYKK
ncbi:MAG: 50S ribosomal protein L19e [Candidatus Micrarchaeia archaeon]